MDDLWKKLWERKYEMPRSPEGKLRSQTEKKGCAIWNLVRANRYLIREHSFWEVREGDKENFWEEAWQQREKLNKQPLLQEIHQFTIQTEGNTVRHYWSLESDGYWRKWKQKENYLEALVTAH